MFQFDNFVPDEDNVKCIKIDTCFFDHNGNLINNLQDGLSGEYVDDALAGEYEFYTYDQYWEHHEQWESFETTHTTKSGDEVVAFGYYGYDG